MPKKPNPSDRPIPPDAVCVGANCKHTCRTFHWCTMTGDREHSREFILCDDCLKEWKSRSPSADGVPAQPALNDVTMRQEARRQGAFNRLGTDNPICACCCEGDWRCMELHHLAGRNFGDFLVVVCRNCHRKLSVMQKDHPPKLGTPPTTLETISHFLHGLADVLEMVIEKLREFAEYLLEEARRQAGKAEPPAS